MSQIMDIRMFMCGGYGNFRGSVTLGSNIPSSV